MNMFSISLLNKTSLTQTNKLSHQKLSNVNHRSFSYLKNDLTTKKITVLYFKKFPVLPAFLPQLQKNLIGHSFSSIGSFSFFQLTQKTIEAKDSIFSKISYRERFNSLFFYLKKMQKNFDAFYDFYQKKDN